jgi:nicotinamide-nucleotide amidase
MNAEIITIGTELLLGQIVDSNAAYLAQQLAAVGLNLYRKTTVGDNQDRIAAAVQEALGRCQVVLCSGGLGPTVDDVTREAIAQATGRQLVLNEGLLAQIEAFFARRGFPLGENNRRQAFIPEGALPIENPVGTAPGFIVESDGRYVIAVPGVPREMRHLTETQVMPFLRERLGLHAVIKVRVLRTVSLPESQLDRLIDDLEHETNPTVGLSAHPGQVDVRITARADSEAEAEAMIALMEARARERLGDAIFGIDKDTLEGVVGELLKTRGVTVALVETNSGGAVTQRLTRTAAGQAALRECFVAGDAAALSRLLDLPLVDGEMVSQETAVSAAQAIRWLAGADVGLAAIGDTDPTVDPYGERTGRTHLALATENKTAHRELWVGGTSDLARAWVSNWALDLLRKELAS